MNDQEKADRIEELMAEASALIAQLDEDVDPTVREIIDAIEGVRADIEILSFGDDGELVEPDDVDFEEEELWEDDEDDMDDDEEDEEF